MPTLPLFPLRVVLYPHMPLPLHVFESRYRALLRDCREDGGRFGVVAIRSGEEVGGAADPEPVGTVAVITKSVPLPEGRSSLLVVGGERYRIRQLVPGAPYLRAEVEYLDDPEPDPASFILASEARDAFLRYAARLARLSGRRPGTSPPPTDPLLLSWVIASALMVELPHKQHLLEIEGVGTRLRAELALLRRELRLLDLDLANRVLPAPSFGRN
ncbi:MAG: LON peptidase substrate-binding domain-containing protein [Candidatus Dormibacteria bacterium]